MKTIRSILIILILGILAAPLTASAGRTWVFFKDKGYQTQRDLQQALKTEELRLLPSTRSRLQKVRPAGGLLCEQDLPVFPFYLDAIEKAVQQKPHAVSRTLNAATFLLDSKQMEMVANFPFVSAIQPVRQFKSDPEPLSPQKSNNRTVQDSLFYGDSYLQNQIGNFVAAHDHGYTGQGIFVGMLDAGWDTLQHPCFDSLEIIATWDFVNGDSSVANDPGQLGIGSHGTATLSCMAGLDPGNLVGTAYGISVALAKTENTQSELPVEEDNWIAGIEWLDSLGCVLVTSSVSYYNFDDGSSYSYSDLDGNTAPITIAADYEVQRGIVVVNSMGNRGNYTYPNNKMKVPADGDSVLSVGAVQGDSSRASFSSLGPTYDQRTKPDLVALGSSVKVAVRAPYPYEYSSGTSFSTPITAGACALLLQAVPGLTPMQVQSYLKNSATQAENPDTLLGWGVYDVWRAIQTALSAVPGGEIKPLPANFVILSAHPNPFNSTLNVYLTLPAPGEFTLGVFDLQGRRITSLTSKSHNPGLRTFIWDAKAQSSGIYLIRAGTVWGEKTCKVVLLK
ncbi:MAG: S8 family serine peptidase [bacterium]|nr:S8 family serine peptidase [bacterium]